MIDSILQAVPLWLVGLFLIAACIFAAQLGRYIRRRSGRDSVESGKTRSDAEGYVIGAIFGLLAFIIGLTFSIAVDRHDTRRGWVTEETTAISTVFLRAGLFDEPHRTRLQSTLREYAHTRIAPDGVWAAIGILAVLILVKQGSAIAALIGDGSVFAIAVTVSAGLLAGHLLGGPAIANSNALAVASAIRHPGIAALIAHQNFSDHHVMLAVILFLMTSVILVTLYQLWLKRRLTVEPAGQPA